MTIAVWFKCWLDFHAVALLLKYILIEKSHIDYKFLGEVFLKSEQGAFLVITGVNLVPNFFLQQTKERTGAVAQTSLEHIFNQHPPLMIETCQAFGEMEPFSFN